MRAPLAPLPHDARAAVVVPARESAATIGRAVASVVDDPRVEEVVLAVGPSADGTREAADVLAARHPKVRVVDNPSGRTPDALNAAIAASTAPVVVRLDAHAELPEGYVGRALEQLRATGAANVGGRQVPTATGGFAAGVAAAMRSPVGAGGAAYRTGDRAGAVDTVYLGVFRREALQHVGGFDGRFTRNQDAELNLRLARAGYTVWFDPELAVAYRPRGSVRSLARQYLEYGRWRRFTARTHPGSLRLRQLAAPALLAAVVASGVASVVLRDARPLGAVLGTYAVVVLAGGAAAADRPRDVARTALALVVMHGSWGTGFLLGPPAEAAARQAAEDQP